MKIDQIHPGAAEGAARSNPGQSVQSGSAQISFAQQLSQLSDAQFEAHYADLVNAIFKQGENIVKRADMREFVRYREMIRQLLNETVSNGFAFRKFRKFDARGRAKTFALIDKINAKLEELMNELLSKEADHIRLLRSIDDIRGLLVDLFM